MLTDKSPCPVQGKHHGKPMEQVPADYLDWLVGQPWCRSKYPAVDDYVARNRKAIDLELREKGKID